MRPDEFRDLLRRRPFRPFRIHLTNGMTYEVRHPEMAVLERSIVWLYRATSPFTVPVADRGEFIVLIHIVRGEWIDPPSPPAAGTGASQPEA
jgi:hypothetical protein